MLESGDQHDCDEDADEYSEFDYWAGPDDIPDNFDQPEPHQIATGPVMMSRSSSQACALFDRRPPDTGPLETHVGPTDHGAEDTDRRESNLERSRRVRGAHRREDPQLGIASDGTRKQELLSHQRHARQDAPGRTQSSIAAGVSRQLAGIMNCIATLSDRCSDLERMSALCSRCSEDIAPREEAVIKEHKRLMAEIASDLRGYPDASDGFAFEAIQDDGLVMLQRYVASLVTGGSSMAPLPPNGSAFPRGKSRPASAGGVAAPEPAPEQPCRSPPTPGGAANVVDSACDALQIAHEDSVYATMAQNNYRMPKQEFDVAPDPRQRPCSVTPASAQQKLSTAASGRDTFLGSSGSGHAGHSGHVGANLDVHPWESADLGPFGEPVSAAPGQAAPKVVHYLHTQPAPASPLQSGPRLYDPGLACGGVAR